MRRLFPVALLLALFLVPFASTADNPAAADDQILPPAKTSGGMPLANALASRRSVRAFTGTALTKAEVSQLLWAAQGITDSKGHRTAPSAMARYFLTVYVATPDGLFQYRPDGHKLHKLSSVDLRTKLSTQPWAASAPTVFIITGDYTRAMKSLGEMGTRCVDLEAGHATQNLLLQATAMELGGVSAAGFDPSEVAKLASLPDSSRPIYLVPIGHPKP